MKTDPAGGCRQVHEGFISHMSQDAPLKLYNTLSRSKDEFRPIDPKNVRMYVCGPTVYDFAHIGNARPAIVFDVLFRLLRHLYGAANVTYVRNITDVDDKINARALRDFGDEIASGRLTLNEAIARVTEKTEKQYHADVAALGCLEPTREPHATAHIAGMVEMVQTLIDRGHAYVAAGREGREVLFSVPSMPAYGELSRRKLEDQQAGARIAVEDHKKDPADFVLWKESKANEPGWSATFSDGGETVEIHGRPGWHIECSVMSRAFLGETFDIHGGGLDLIFPHHENEIAQSTCAHGQPMANVWMHNGFLQVEGQKMSKSLGNFVTINDLLATDAFGDRRWPGEVLRLAMLMTHYREPIDFSVKRLEEAENLLSKWPRGEAGNALPDLDVVAALSDDLNTVAAIQRLHALAAAAQSDPLKVSTFVASAALLGIAREAVALGEEEIEAIRKAVETRLAFIREKNWTEADRLRDELAARGVVLKDGKDPVSGERVTTWEVKG